MSAEFPYKQVAKYRSSSISPLLYPSVIDSCAKRYNDSNVLIETNGIGQQVADILHNELECENLILVTSKGRAGQGG